ncbi:flagellar filament capping protein FliD [Yersinia vastinensis]|uniref:flagellar filament capping protein FliD n=1 Tax=Yersinia vastinensis TaxID=2890318 RepID=UPI0011AB29E3|nr:flagellar filament capping protein FliD [Yersinia vastinensis]
MLDFDPSQMAQSAANSLFGVRVNRLKGQQTQFKKEQDALNKIQSGLNDFRTALSGMNKKDEGVLKIKTTSSDDDIVTVTANHKAVKGSYTLFVKQLASSHQLALEDLKDSDVTSATGTFTLEIAGKTLSIDTRSLNSVTELAEAINKNKDNKDSDNKELVTASLIRNGGKVVLTLSSNNSGAANEITLPGMGTTVFAGVQQKTLSAAADAEVWLGEENHGIKINHASNVLDSVVEGVTINLTKVQKTGDVPLHIGVEMDTSATQEQVKKFVDAFNSVKKLVMPTRDKPDESKDKEASPTYSSHSNNGISALNSVLNSLVRQRIDGKSILDFGIKTNRDGGLEIDSKKFEQAIKDAPKALVTLLNDDTGLLKKLDNAIEPYVNKNNGLLKGRTESIERKSASTRKQLDMLEEQYNRALERYLLQFSKIKDASAQMALNMQAWGFNR